MDALTATESSGAGITLSFWSLFSALSATPPIPSGPFLAFFENVYYVGKNTAIPVVSISTLAYLYLAHMAVVPGNRAWCYAAAAFLLGAWAYTRLLMREQLNKPLLEMRKRVNQDHKQVSEKEVMDLLRTWTWFNLGRGVVFMVAFLCGVVGLAV